MAIATEKFVITEVVWDNIPSREIGIHANHQVTSRPKSITAYCLSCHNTWVTNVRDGGLRAGGVKMTCSNCEQEEFVRGNLFIDS